MRYRSNVRCICTIVPSMMMVLLLVAAPVRYVIVTAVRIAMIFAVFVGPDGPSRFYWQRHCTVRHRLR